MSNRLKNLKVMKKLVVTLVTVLTVSVSPVMGSNFSVNVGHNGVTISVNDHDNGPALDRFGKPVPPKPEVRKPEPPKTEKRHDKKGDKHNLGDKRFDNHNSRNHSR